MESTQVRRMERVSLWLWTSSIYSVHMSRFHVKTERESNLRNVMFYIKDRTVHDVQNCDTYINTPCSADTFRKVTVRAELTYVHRQFYVLATNTSPLSACCKHPEWGNFSFWKRIALRTDPLLSAELTWTALHYLHCSEWKRRAR
jgi:hypothetical protein